MKEIVPASIITDQSLTMGKVIIKIQITKLFMLYNVKLNAHLHRHAFNSDIT